MIKASARSLARARNLGYSEALRDVRATYIENRELSLEVKHEYDYWNSLILMTDRLMLESH